MQPFLNIELIMVIILRMNIKKQVKSLLRLIYLPKIKNKKILKLNRFIKSNYNLDKNKICY